MSIRSILVVVLALVFGGSAAIGINTLVRAPAAPKVETVPVVVAAADVSRFAVLTEDMVKLRDYPKQLVPPGALNRIEDAVERITGGTLVKDEPVLDAKLAP